MPRYNQTYAHESNYIHVCIYVLCVMWISESSIKKTQRKKKFGGAPPSPSSPPTPASRFCWTHGNLNVHTCILSLVYAAQYQRVRVSSPSYIPAIYVEHYNNVLVYTDVPRSLPRVMVHAYRVRKIRMEELLNKPRICRLEYKINGNERISSWSSTACKQSTVML